MHLIGYIVQSFAVAELDKTNQHSFVFLRCLYRTFWRRLSSLSFLAITILLFFLFISNSWRNSAFSNEWLWDSSEDLMMSIFTSRNIFVFGSRIFWRTELLSFRRNARNVKRNLRERKEHLNCKQSLIIRVCSRVYAFFWRILHRRSCYFISPLLSDFFYFILLFWVLT